MKIAFNSFLFLLIGSFLRGQSIAHPPNNTAFLQDEVASVFISMDPQDLNVLLSDSLYSDYHFNAQFIYESSQSTDTIYQVGFRVRGNTSRDAYKKSFKVSFNEFISGQKFHGIEKMNLIGQHNDPSLLRYWLSLNILQSQNLIASRASFVKLYVNAEYKGIYLNVEHIDDEFLQKRFLNDDQGNLYKCYWGANLNYLGTTPAAYYSIYELKTNKVANDYTGLIDFLQGLNTVSDNDFACFIAEHFDVEHYLQTLVNEIMIGHWDGYAYNMNNFYLYQRPSDGKFVFIEYDMDNTFGIDWFGIDWSSRNINSWQNTNRPLIQRILSVPFYLNMFRSLAEQFIVSFDQATWNDRLVYAQSLLSQGVSNDSYYPLDYGFQHSDFLNALEVNYGLHVDQGIIPYLVNRLQTAYSQMILPESIDVPCDLGITYNDYASDSTTKIYNLLGQEVKTESDPSKLLILRYSNGTTKKIFNP